MPSPPASIEDVAQLDDLLSDPTPVVVETLNRLDGDFLILGAGGKMGPTLARMIRRALDESKTRRRVIAVSRFSSGSNASSLQAWGIETLSADLLDPAQLNGLPDVRNVIYMAGMKFGSTNQEALTWAMNSYLPGMVCQKFRDSRIIAFSTGNIYGLAPVSLGGSVESDPLVPDGDYAMSCLGRERIFEHFSRTLKIPVSIVRLNYATELRYGVLVDLAKKILASEPIHLAMGNVNVIWQADANAMALCAFDRAASPPFLLNVAGPEVLSIRRVCEQLGQLMKKPVTFTGAEAPNTLLSNGQLGHRLYGYPRVGIQQVLEWTADWVLRGGASLSKPTHFEARDGKF